MSLLVSELLSLDINNPVVSITGVVLSLSTLLTLGIALAKYLLKNLVLDSFDIKLLHKNNHSAIKIAKSLTSITLIGLFLLGVDWYLFFVISQFSVLEVILLFTVVIYSVIFLLSLVIFKVYDFIRKRKVKKGVHLSNKKKGIFISFINNFNTIFIISLTFLFILFGTLLLVVLNVAGDKTQNLLGISFLFSIIPSICIFFYKPLKTKRYELSKILTEPIDIANYELNLEYSIDNRTSVLSNKNENIAAIKHNYEGNYSVEIYKVIEIYQPKTPLEE